MALLAAALVVYLNQFAEPRWYPLAPDMERWLSISLALFVFLAVVKILSPRRSSLD
jgi:type VI protein secretion system component VasK